MYEKKKLLILGANPETVSLVEKANSMGYYTIVTDYDPKAYAKKFASKSYNVDASDVDKLVEIAEKEKHTDPILKIRKIEPEILFLKRNEKTILYTASKTDLKIVLFFILSIRFINTFINDHIAVTGIKKQTIVKIDEIPCRPIVFISATNECPLFSSIPSGFTILLSTIPNSSLT